MDTLHFTIILVLFLVFANDFENIGLLRLLIGKKNRSIKNLSDPILFSDAISKIELRKLKDKEIEVIPLIGNRGNANPHQLSITENYLLIGTTKLTYIYKVEKKDIIDVSYVSKYDLVHKISIKVSSGNEVDEYLISRFLPGKKIKKSCETIVEMLKQVKS